MSGRPKAKFVTVHCAALSPQLLESELFGHEKGAFTGAMERRIGRFEQATGGTIFLDEIGEIDQTTQVKLLRVLGEERSFERVGGNASIKVDIRLVAATNRDLESMVDAGEFRSDLFFRLNVVPIHLPPLRDRKEDIPLLVQSFLTQFAKDNGKGFRELTSDAMQAVLAYGWPGNVRELRTAIEHGVVMSTGAKITLRDLPGSVRGEQRRAPTRDRALGSGGAEGGATVPVVTGGAALRLEEVEERVLLDALRACRGNATEAGRRLGVSRRTMQRRVADLRARGLIGASRRGRPLSEGD
jgi:DNA-binding NtrC family response regulator